MLQLATSAGLEKLNSFLLSNSYAGGWVPSQVDVGLFNAIKSAPDGMSFLHVFNVNLCWVSKI